MSTTRSVPLELSLGVPSFAASDPGSWDHLFELACAADRSGVDRLTVSDHVVFGEQLDEYGRPEVGGITGGQQPTGPDGLWLEPMTTLSVIAGMTSRVRLRTSILIAALRRPVVLAKSASTLDVLSGGRLELGVGVGWQREEYEAAGLSFEGRGKLLDDTLEVSRTLWRERVASYSSSELTFRNIHQMPKPLQEGGVPIWVSGTINAAVVRRLGRFGTGWIRWGKDADDANAIDRMKQALADAGYDMPALRVTGRLAMRFGAGGRPHAEATIEPVPAMIEAGISDFMLPALDEATQQAPEEWLRAIVDTFRDATDRPRN
jgi:probable F420-dependent oxidoreductase